MVTALVSGCYLLGNDPSGSDRLLRMKKFLRYYWPLATELGFEEIYLIDNASPRALLGQIHREATVLRYVNHLERGPEENEYPYCWRILYSLSHLIALGYEKIIFVDSDCFVLSPGLAHHIRTLKSGWEAFDIERYRFPSAELYVLCEDAFPRYYEYTRTPWPTRVGALMERDIPFMTVNRNFRVDRWGETRAPQEPWMDAYSNAPVDIKLEYRE